MGATVHPGLNVCLQRFALYLPLDVHSVRGYLFFSWVFTHPLPVRKRITFLDCGRCSELHLRRPWKLQCLTVCLVSCLVSSVAQDSSVSWKGCITSLTSLCYVVFSKLLLKWLERQRTLLGSLVLLLKNSIKRCCKTSWVNAVSDS